MAGLHRNAPLLIVAASAAAGHILVVAPLVDAVRPHLDRLRPVAAERPAIRAVPLRDDTDDGPARLLPLAPVPPAPWQGMVDDTGPDGGAFHAGPSREAHGHMGGDLIRLPWQRAEGAQELHPRPPTSSPVRIR